jgi:thermitase
MKAFIFLLIFSVCRNCFAAEFILKLKPDSDALSLNDFNILTFAYNSAAQLYKVDLSQSQFINLSLNKNVQYLVPNIKIQIKDFSRPETLVAPQKQWNLEKVNAAQAWALAGNKGSRKIVVAVIDSGVDANHPDLKGNVLPGFNFVDNTTNATDEFGHGTHCAGVIGATGSTNGGVLGVSPEVSILPVRFLSKTGLGDLYTGIQAIDYAIEKKVDIISASWGAQISKPELIVVLREAAERADKAGIMLVTAAGNLNRNNDIVDVYPANSNTSSILSVAGTDQNDVKMKISNYGSKNVHTAAPGVDIVSTSLNGKYKVMTGTSMATPLVAGLAAFLKAQRPNLTAAEIRKIILENGAPAQVEDLCHCRIDAEAATKYILSKAEN